MPTEQVYFTIKQAAELTGLSEMTWYRRIWANKVPGARRFGRSWRIHRSEIFPE